MRVMLGEITYAWHESYSLCIITISYLLLFKQNSLFKNPWWLPNTHRMKTEPRCSSTFPSLCLYGSPQIPLPRWAAPHFSTAPPQRFSRLSSISSQFGPLPSLPRQPGTSLRTGSSLLAFLGLWHGARLTNICFCLPEVSVPWEDLLILIFRG